MNYLPAFPSGQSLLLLGFAFLVSFYQWIGGFVVLLCYCTVVQLLLKLYLVLSFLSEGLPVDGNQLTTFLCASHRPHGDPQMIRFGAHLVLVLRYLLGDEMKGAFKDKIQSVGDHILHL